MVDFEVNRAVRSVRATAILSDWPADPRRAGGRRQSQRGAGRRSRGAAESPRAEGPLSVSGAHAAPASVVEAHGGPERARSSPVERPPRARPSTALCAGGPSSSAPRTALGGGPSECPVERPPRAWPSTALRAGAPSSPAQRAALGGAPRDGPRRSSAGGPPSARRATARSTARQPSALGPKVRRPAAERRPAEGARAWSGRAALETRRAKGPWRQVPRRSLDRGRGDRAWRCAQRTRAPQRPRRALSPACGRTLAVRTVPDPTAVASSPPPGARPCSLRRDRRQAPAPQRTA